MPTSLQRRPVYGKRHSLTRSRPKRSEVRRIGDRHRIFLKREGLLVTQVVLRVGPFRDWAVDLLPADRARPRRLECARVVNHDGRVERISVIADLPPFHHVLVLGVRGGEIIHEAVGMLNETDGVDDKLAVLVMAEGFAEPGRLGILTVFAVEIDPAHLMVALPDHPDLLRGLDEIEGLKKQQLTWGAAGPTPGLGTESAMSLFYQFVVHAHLGGRPGG